MYMLAFQGMSQAVSTTPTSPPSRQKSNSTRSPLTQPALHSQHPVFRLSAAEQGATEALSTAYTLEYVVVTDSDMQFRWYANPKSKDTLAQHTALMANHLDFLMQRLGLGIRILFKAHIAWTADQIGWSGTGCVCPTNSARTGT